MNRSAAIEGPTHAERRHNNQYVNKDEIPVY
jgi:hypothetical protein